MEIINKKNKPACADRQKGVSLIITFFVMVIIVSIVLIMSTLLYSQLKVIKNIGDSVIAFYAADSGVEKILFYNRQAIPDDAARGLCSIFDTRSPSGTLDIDPCEEDTYPSGTGDHSIFCNKNGLNEMIELIDPTNYPNGCDPEECNNCRVTFETTLTDRKKYVVKAEVTIGIDGESIDFSIDSTGSYENVERAVNIFITKATPQQIINLIYATARPRSVEEGFIIDIEVRATSPNGISNIYADVKSSSAIDGSNIIESFTLQCDNTGDLTERTCCAGDPEDRPECDVDPDPIFPPGNYYVDIRVVDAQQIELIARNIPPYVQ